MCSNRYETAQRDLYLILIISTACFSPVIQHISLSTNMPRFYMKWIFQRKCLDRIGPEFELWRCVAIFN